MLIGDIAEILRGVSYRKDVATETPEPDHVPLLRATNIQKENLLLDSNLVYVPKSFVSSKQYLKKWDIVVCMSSGSKNLVGKTGQLLGDWSGTFGTFCAALRFDQSIDPRYAGYFFGSSEYRHFISEQSSGVNINNLRGEDLADLHFPLPPLSEQQRIVASIETNFTRLDAGVAALRRVQANLHRYRASVLKAACEGKLVPTEAELARAEGRDYEPAAVLLDRILAERRAKWAQENPKKKYVEPAGPDVSRLPDLPEGWCWATIKAVGKVQLGRQRAPQHHQGPHMRPYLRVANVFEDRIDTGDVLEMNFTPSEYETYRLHYGDILLNEGQSPEYLGRPAMFRNEIPDACFQNTLIRFQACDSLDRGFALILFRHYLHKGRFRNESQITTNIAHLSAGRFAEIECPLPPLSEQRRIVTEVERLLSVANAMMATVETNLFRFGRLRQSILQQAFTGRLAL